ncbi:conserved hypothetical protein [Solidesulfovibrio fructosivorans JJ]]|uniref:Permuted papain-like amidase YaeF/Yiix C92 family enzyme n=1 Tax=Solidesulfovibrio fructosivorans JJ] TaxID=596151 RepID=E1JVT6_SOLFR|nr:YiiX/YebB-like N1pC/P60 family cysteine hydrolase [Solidesulfovibrio fructosivorans]EFL51574.1 conserved hypothetical protein [Solidesulfovibrio fructosivorans JJ]]
MQYQGVRERLKTGDILLFSGKSRISEGIKFFSKSKWSHVGMVYRFCSPLDPQGSVFCWEATTLCNVKDADTGKLTKGVQRVELSERLERCFAQGYEIAVRPLSKPLEDDMVFALNAFRHEVSGRPYEKHLIELIKSLYDGFFGENKEDLSSLFCSELVAECYQRMGLLPEAPGSNEYTPKDFSCEKGLCLGRGYGLEYEIEIDSL